MEELLPLLQKYEVWIYVLLGAIALINLQKLVSAWYEWRSMVFGLEREIAQRRFTASLTVLILLVLFVFAEFMIVSFVTPSYPQASTLPTLTLDVLATPTVTLVAQVEAAATAPADEVTVGTLEGQAEGCTPGQIEWTYPTPGMEVKETVPLKGTVNVPSLGFYKYEYKAQGSDVWSTLAANNTQKIDAEIGFWNTSQLVPGDYLLRLVVVDNQNKPFPVCVIPVRIVQP